MIPFFKSPLLENIPSLKHGFFTRQGGVSKSPFDTLNASYDRSDPNDNITENRFRVLKTLGFEIPSSEFVPIATANQVHRDQVVVIDSYFTRGNVPEADAIVTRTKGIVIGVLTADCTPVLFCDPEAQVVGAAHAGWKGAHKGILEQTVEAMIKQGASKNRIIAAIGPCIHQESYEVSEEFFKTFESPSFFKEGINPKAYLFDLPGYVKSRLQNIGLSAISPSLWNTYTAEDLFFSHRRSTHRHETQRGNQVSVIGLL